MATSVEVLRNGHAVSKCGVATLEYLFDYALCRGVEVGKPTRAGKTQHGKYVSILVVDGKLVRADFSEDIKGNKKLRRLSPKRFTKMCDALASRKIEGYVLDKPAKVRAPEAVQTCITD